MRPVATDRLPTATLALLSPLALTLTPMAMLLLPVPLDENLHLTEKFSLLDKDTLLYQYTVDDPTIFTRPWSGQLYMSRSPDQIYEYACHEGNYAMPSILSGARLEEKRSK